MRFTMCSIAVVLSVLCCVKNSAAVDGQIVLYADMGQTVPHADLQTNTPLKLYVFAMLQGGSQGGFQGAEYQIAPSANTDWIFTDDFTETAGRGGIVIGAGTVRSPVNPNPGVNIAFGSCQAEPSVLMHTLTVIDFTGTFAGQAVSLRVEGHSKPGNPFFRCPLFTLCDDPVFTKVCLGWVVSTEVCPFPPGALACFASTSGTFFVNSDPSAVEARSWSQVKSLFHQ